MEGWGEEKSLPALCPTLQQPFEMAAENTRGRMRPVPHQLQGARPQPHPLIPPRLPSPPDALPAPLALSLSLRSPPPNCFRHACLLLPVPRLVPVWRGGTVRDEGGHGGGGGTRFTRMCTAPRLERHVRVGDFVRPSAPALAPSSVSTTSMCTTPPPSLPPSLPPIYLSISQMVSLSLTGISPAGAANLRLPPAAAAVRAGGHRPLHP